MKKLISRMSAVGPLFLLLTLSSALIFIAGINATIFGKTEEWRVIGFFATYLGSMLLYGARVSFKSFEVNRRNLISILVRGSLLAILGAAIWSIGIRQPWKSFAIVTLAFGGTVALASLLSLLTDLLSKKNKQGPQSNSE
ncbi:MAG: hypothetical protein ABI430_01865 [Candidatus Taylorbacteria bacterium]